VSAIVEVTGLRNPCKQLDDYHVGLLAAVLDRDAQGNLVRKAGIMGVVLAGGEIRPGDAVAVELPPRRLTSGWNRFKAAENHPLMQGWIA